MDADGNLVLRINNSYQYVVRKMAKQETGKVKKI